MPELLFYQQGRRDGGIRTGVEIDGESIMGVYEDGSTELRDDPMGSVLDWFVDIRCVGESLPSEPEAVRGWFLKNAERIKSGLRVLGDTLRVGVDTSVPIIWSASYDDDRHRPPTAEPQITFTCDTTRRFAGRELGKVLSRLSDDFESLVKELAPPVDSLR